MSSLFNETTIATERLQYCGVSGDAWISMTQSNTIFNLPERDLAFRVCHVYACIKNADGSEEDSADVPELNVHFRVENQNTRNEDNNFFLFDQFSTNWKHSSDPIKEVEISKDLADRIQGVARMILEFETKHQAVNDAIQNSGIDYFSKLGEFMCEAFENNDKDITGFNDPRFDKVSDKMEALFPEGWEKECDDPMKDQIKTTKRELGLEIRNQFKKLGIRV